ncbi:MAG: hypothetical protein ACJ05G_03905 [Actinomycetota bacterium]
MARRNLSCSSRPLTLVHWTEHIPSAFFDVRCEGSDHRVIWSEGKLSLCAHLEIDAERALIALGGKTPSCLKILNLWESAVSDGGFIEEWAGHFKEDTRRRWWLSTALDRLKSEGVQDFFHDLPRTRATRMCEVTLGLPHEFLDLAAVTVLAQADEGLRDLDEYLFAHSALATQMRSRRSFVLTLQAHESSFKSPALIPFRCEVNDDITPTIAGVLAGKNSEVLLTLRPSWLNRVWARNLAIYQKRLTIDAVSKDNELYLSQVEWTCTTVNTYTPKVVVTKI